MPWICLGLDVGAEGAAAQPTEWLTLVAFGSQFWTRNSICLKNFWILTVTQWSQLVGVSFPGPRDGWCEECFFAHVSIRRRFTFLIWFGVWAASKTLVLLRFSFGFSRFRIACGLSWCWNGVPISCGPAHMVFARIVYRAYPPVLVLYYFDVTWPCISRSRQ